MDSHNNNNNNYASGQHHQSAPIELEQPGQSAHGYYGSPAPSQQQQQQYGSPQQQPYAQWPGAYGVPVTGYHQYQGQHQQQQPQQPQQQQTYQQPTAAATGAATTPAPTYGPDIPRDTPKWRMAKLIMHGLVILFSIIIIALSLSTLSNAGFYGLVTVVTIPLPAIALIWSAAELITRVVRKPKWQAGIHPGAHVALHLLLWLASVILGGSYVTTTVVVQHVDCTYTTYDYDLDRYVEEKYDGCDDYTLDGYRGTMAAIAAFTILNFILQFTLFVMACRDTHMRNIAKRKGPVLYVQHPQAYYAGWQPMPGSSNGQQQQQAGMQMGNYPTQNTRQQDGQQYMAVPNPHAATERSGLDRTPSPASTPYATPMEDGLIVNEKGKEPERNPELGGYYSPSGHR